jgi:outer membrane receptor protein involved in Fe transport
MRIIRTFTPTDRLSLTVSLRVDDWKNYDGHNLETNVATGQPVPPGTNNGVPTGNQPNLPDRKDTAVSPRGGAMYRISDKVSVWGSVSGGFRAPTLNGCTAVPGRGAARAGQ